MRKTPIIMGFLVSLCFVQVCFAVGPEDPSQGEDAYYYSPDLYPNLFLPEGFRNQKVPENIVTAQKHKLTTAVHNILKRLTVVITDENTKKSSDVLYFDLILAEAKKIDPGVKIIPSGGVVRAVLSYIYDEMRKGKTIEQLTKEQQEVRGSQIRGVGSDFDIFAISSNGKFTEIKDRILKLTNSSEEAFDLRDDEGTEKRSIFTVGDTKEFNEHLKRSVPQGGSILDFLGFDYEAGQFVMPTQYPHIIDDFLRGTYEYIAPTTKDAENFHKQLIRGFRPLIEIPFLNIKDENQIRSELEQAISETLAGNFPTGDKKEKAMEQFSKMLRNSRDYGARNRMWRGKPKSIEELFFTYITAIKQKVTNNKNPFPEFVQYRDLEFRNFEHVPSEFLISIEDFNTKYTNNGKFFHGTPNLNNALAMIRGGIFESYSENGGAGIYGKAAYASNDFDFAAGYANSEGIIFELELKKNSNIQILNYQQYMQSKAHKKTQAEAKALNMDHFDYLMWKYGVDIIINHHILIKNAAVIQMEHGLTEIVKGLSHNLKNKQVSFDVRYKKFFMFQKIIKYSVQSGDFKDITAHVNIGNVTRDMTLEMNEILQSENEQLDNYLRDFKKLNRFLKASLELTDIKKIMTEINYDDQNKILLDRLVANLVSSKDSFVDYYRDFEDLNDYIATLDRLVDVHELKIQIGYQKISEEIIYRVINDEKVEREYISKLAYRKQEFIDNHLSIIEKMLNESDHYSFEQKQRLIVLLCNVKIDKMQTFSFFPKYYALVRDVIFHSSALDATYYDGYNHDKVSVSLANQFDNYDLYSQKSVDIYLTDSEKLFEAARFFGFDLVNFGGYNVISRLFRDFEDVIEKKERFAAGTENAIRLKMYKKAMEEAFNYEMQYLDDQIQRLELTVQQVQDIKIELFKNIASVAVAKDTSEKLLILTSDWSGKSVSDLRVFVAKEQTYHTPEYEDSMSWKKRIEPETKQKNVLDIVMKENPSSFVIDYLNQKESAENMLEDILMEPDYSRYDLGIFESYDFYDLDKEKAGLVAQSMNNSAWQLKEHLLHNMIETGNLPDDVISDLLPLAMKENQWGVVKIIISNLNLNKNQGSYIHNKLRDIYDQMIEAKKWSLAAITLADSRVDSYQYYDPVVFENILQGLSQLESKERERVFQVAMENEKWRYLSKVASSTDLLEKYYRDILVAQTETPFKLNTDLFYAILEKCSSVDLSFAFDKLQNTAINTKEERNQHGMNIRQILLNALKNKRVDIVVAFAPLEDEWMYNRAIEELIEHDQLDEAKKLVASEKTSEENWNRVINRLINAKQWDSIIDLASKGIPEEWKSGVIWAASNQHRTDLIKYFATLKDMPEKTVEAAVTALAEDGDSQTLDELKVELPNLDWSGTYSKLAAHWGAFKGQPATLDWVKKNFPSFDWNQQFDIGYSIAHLAIFADSAENSIKTLQWIKEHITGFNWNATDIHGDTIGQSAAKPYRGRERLIWIRDNIPNFNWLAEKEGHSARNISEGHYKYSSGEYVDEEKEFYKNFYDHAEQNYKTYLASNKTEPRVLRDRSENDKSFDPIDRMLDPLSGASDQNAVVPLSSLDEQLNLLWPELEEVRKMKDSLNQDTEPFIAMRLLGALLSGSYPPHVEQEKNENPHIQKYAEAHLVLMKKIESIFQSYGYDTEISASESFGSDPIESLFKLNQYRLVIKPKIDDPIYSTVKKYFSGDLAPEFDNFKIVIDPFFGENADAGVQGFYTLFVDLKENGKNILLGKLSTILIHEIRHFYTTFKLLRGIDTVNNVNFKNKNGFENTYLAYKNQFSSDEMFAYASNIKDGHLHYQDVLTQIATTILKETQYILQNPENIEITFDPKITEHGYVGFYIYYGTDKSNSLLFPISAKMKDLENVREYIYKALLKLNHNAYGVITQLSSMDKDAANAQKYANKLYNITKHDDPFDIQIPEEPAEKSDVWNFVVRDDQGNRLPEPQEKVLEDDMDLSMNDKTQGVRTETLTQEELAGIDQFIKVAAEYRSALREKDKIIKESKEQKKSPDTNPAFQTAKDKIEIKYQEMLRTISTVFEGRGFIVSEVNAPNKPKMIGIQPTVDTAAYNELSQYPYTDVLWIDPTSMGDYFAQYYQKIVISVMPTGLKGLLLGNLQPLFYHELVHAKTFYKMMNTPDHTIYLNGFAEITHGSDIPSQYRQGLSVDEINAYSDTVRIYMELIQNSASASEIYENIKSLELNTKMLMILSEEIHSNLIKMKLAFYNDDGESISNAIDQYAKSITDFKSADEYQDILIKHVRENHVVNLRFKMDGFTYDAVFKSKEIFELLHQYASTKDQKLKLKIADLAKEILRDDREKIKLLSAHSAEMGKNINEAVKSIIDKIKYKPKDSFDKTKPGVDPRYSLEAIKTDFQEVLEQLQKNVTTVYENTRDGSEPFRKIIGGSSSDKPNSGILSFLGLGEWADRNASDKPGLTRQAWDWVKEKFVSDDEGGVAVDEALQEEMQKLPTNQDLVDSGLPLEMRDGNLVVREVPVIANTPMSDTQTTGQSKTKTATETSRDKPKTSIAELREIVDGIEKRITTEEKKSYFDSKKERLIALQTELIHDSEHRVEIIRTLGKASVGSRALDQYKSEAIYEAPKYFAAMLLSHAALAVEEKGITFDTFVDLIRGFPKELWSNAVSSVGSAGAVMLFDSFAPLVSKKMANAYQVEIMEQFMIKSKGMNAYQMLRRESNLLRGFTRNQFNMLGANLVSLAAFSDPTMSAEEFCFQAAKMQITFLAAQGIVRGIGINGGLALGGESLKTWLSKVRVSSSKAVVTTVVLFAIDMTVQLLFDDDINRTTTTVLLQKQISDGLKEWIKARKSEDFPYVMQSMMAYWETLVFEPLQKITMKYEGLQDELDADLEFVRMRNYTKSYPKLKGSLPAGKQNAINKLWQNYMAESGQAQKELLDTIDANLIKQIKGLKATRQQLLDKVYECNTTFKPLDQCASEEEELKDRIKRLRAAILSHGKEITMYPNDLDPLSNILKTRVIPKTMTVNEWIKLMIGVAKMAKYQEQEQTLESIMQIAEGQYDVRKTPEKYMALNEQVADGFRRSQVEPYLDPIIGRNVMTIIMDETDTPEAIEKKIRERLMEMAYYNKCAAVGGEFKDGFISQRNQIVNSAAYKAQKSRVESRMMNAYSGEWGIPSDSMDKERVMQMLKTTGAILLMPIIQEKKSNRLGKPYTDDVYTVPVTKGLLGPYQQATTCAQ